ncbi:MAG: MBL fold metallo-hydrolase [Octadecabacter sp.]|nr:MBL fold metallo-hydrolase [Octadecabacter sp.]
MSLTRRQFTQLGSAAAATSLLGLRPAFAQVMIGDMEVLSLSDGNLTLPSEMTFGSMQGNDIGPIIEKYQLGDVLTPPCNVTLLKSGDRTVLFDVGAGPEFMSSAGFLTDALDAVGVAVDDVTDVVFTHAHPDHIWGLTDDFDDLLFPNASYMIGQDEWDYWTNPETVDTIDEGRTTFAVGAARRLGRISDAVTFFRDGEEILPGVAARATYGHTPGHMAFEVRQGSNGLMILGDCIGNHHVAFEEPSWKSGSDQDEDKGVETRVALLDQLAQEQTHILGFHLSGNGIGRVERNGSGGYRFIQDA